MKNSPQSIILARRLDPSTVSDAILFGGKFAKNCGKCMFIFLMPVKPSSQHLQENLETFVWKIKSAIPHLTANPYSSIDSLNSAADAACLQ